MNERRESIWKLAGKEAAKDHFLTTPWNALAFFSTLALTKWLCGVVGSAGYGSPFGNFKLSGIMLLAATVAALFIMIGRFLFRIEESKQTDTFWWAGTWIFIGLAGCVTFIGRAILITAGIVHPGGAPPSYLGWVFDPHMLHWLLRLGDPAGSANE